MILLYTLIVSVALFAVYYYINKNNEDKNEDINETQSFFTLNNFIIFCMIYVFIFSLLYLAFDDGSSLASLGILTDDGYSKPNKLTKSNIVNPSVLKHNSDPMKSGFEPYNSNRSENSVSSSETSTSGDSSDSD